MRPLSARSVIASTLLGTHPPRLPGRLLVALTREFDIAPGTARVALSRMVDRGELQNDAGVYELIGPLVLRQHRQDAARAAAGAPWDGGWEQAIVAAGGRSAAVRSHHRREFEHRKMAEIRDGVWVRPANLHAGRGADDTVRADPDVIWGLARFDDGVELARRLWDLDAWARVARRLIRDMAAAQGLDLAEGFALSAAVLRHFLADPELPEALQPPGWPAGELRADYADFDRGYRAQLSAFFRSVAAAH